MVPLWDPSSLLSLDGPRIVLMNPPHAGGNIAETQRLVLIRATAGSFHQVKWFDALFSIREHRLGLDAKTWHGQRLFLENLFRSYFAEASDRPAWTGVGQDSSTAVFISDTPDRFDFLRFIAGYYCGSDEDLKARLDYTISKISVEPSQCLSVSCPRFATKPLIKSRNASLSGVTETAMFGPSHVCVTR
jgi:hypothetical protein